MADPLRRACSILLWRTPLLLPLVAVAGVIYGGTWGWVLAVVALAVAHALGLRRMLLCAVLCGAVVGLSQSLRQEQVEDLQRHFALSEAVTLEGTVVRELSKGCILETSWTGVRVALFGDLPWRAADRVRITGQLLPVRRPLVEGMFSQEKWMRGQGLAVCLSYLHGEKVGESWGWSRLVRVGGELRTLLADQLMPPGSEEDARCQVLCALVLGDKGRADVETLEVFRRGGCLHVFAVSGLHVGLVAGLLWALLRLCRVRPMVGRYVLLGMVGLYVLATGMAVPALRAYLMLAALISGLILRRRTSLFNTWCFAALLILVVEPWQLYQAGFQLSFVVYAAICLGVQYAMGDHPWFGPDAYIPARIRTRGERLAVVAERMVRGTVIVSLCAWLVALPLSMAQFHAVNTGSYLTNIIIAPLLPIIMCVGLAALALGPLPLVGSVCHAWAMQSAGWLIGLVSLSSSYPGAFVPACEPAPPQAYMLACLGYGKSFGVLGNPGLMVGDVGSEGDARFSVEPALFHGGFAPMAVCGGVNEKALSLYRMSWPHLAVVEKSGAEVRRISGTAGEFTLYFPPRPLQGAGQPIILWKQPNGARIIYMGNAAVSTLESLPPEERRADVLILGYSAKEPLLDVDMLRRMGPEQLILLPSAAQWAPDEAALAPTRVLRLLPDSVPVIRYP